MKKEKGKTSVPGRKVTKAHTIYRNDQKVRLPSVTTILGQLGWNKNVLVAWARREALKGNDPNAIRDNAATIGTCGHYLVQCHIAGAKPDLSSYAPAQADKAETAFLAYLEWEKQHDVKVLECEIPIISNAYRYGGTIDAVIMLDGKKTIQDLKTSKGVFPEMRVQVAAYAYGYAEERGEKVLPACLLRIDKETGGFEFHSYPDLSVEWEVFKHARALYDLQKKVK